MFKFNSKAVVLILVCAILFIASSDAFARSRYFFRDGRWYRHGWFGINFVVSMPSVGGYIEVMPPGYTIVYVGSDRYYYYNNVYYRPESSGYVVVEHPVAMRQVVKRVQSGGRAKPISRPMSQPGNDMKGRGQGKSGGYNNKHR